MKHLILFSHQLNDRYIDTIKPDKTTVLATKEQFDIFNYHQFRILYHMSAAKHFAIEKEIDYIVSKNFDQFFTSCPKENHYYFFTPNEEWMSDRLKKKTSHLSSIYHPDINFFFPDITKEIGDPPYKLDPLYRKWRSQFDILMEGDKPIGGKFSYDQDNRNRPPKTLDIPKPITFDMDEISLSIYESIKTQYAHHPTSDEPFKYPVTQTDAKALLKHFIDNRLKYYGKYQDAMMANEPFMVHSLLSASINLGLLFAEDVVKEVEKAYHEDKAPIEAVEGFIRQVLGWREYIRGIYFKEMPDGYGNLNKLTNQSDKPSFLYNGKISLRCISTVITETINYGYNHHIERLMIIGNILNLLGVSPQNVREWFNEMYIDSFDWVVTPNVIGMAMYADGGLMSTKPYVASANYINKMSNYCKDCIFDPKEKYGDKACPVNALYYAFLDRHKSTLQDNPRMKFMYMNYKKLSTDNLNKLLDLANHYIDEH